jgi:hypothetical protein
VSTKFTYCGNTLTEKIKCQKDLGITIFAQMENMIQIEHWFNMVGTCETILRKIAVQLEAILSYALYRKHRECSMRSTV